VQKVLVKLRGTEKQRPLLNELMRKLPGEKSAALLGRLTSDLDDFGSFQATR
jgi:5-methylcytosine-specific restriction protein B